MDEDQVIQSILRRLDRLTDEFSELRDGVRKVIRIASDDPEMALTRARKVLEYLIRDLYVRRYNEEPGTRPLENLLQRLARDGHLPKRLGAYANAIRELGNVGTHGYGEAVTMSDVRQSLSQLMVLLEWYFENERPEGVLNTGKLRAPEGQTVTQASQQTASADSARHDVYAENVGRTRGESFGHSDGQAQKETLPIREDGRATELKEPAKTKSPAQARSAWGWVVSLPIGLIAGIFGGEINIVLLSTNMTVYQTDALIVCGLIPGIVAALGVNIFAKIPLQIILGLVLGGIAVEIVFFLGWAVAGGPSTFVAHLPFWLGPGDDHIMTGEAFMLAFPLGALPGVLAGILQGLKTKLFRG